MPGHFAGASVAWLAAARARRGRAALAVLAVTLSACASAPRQTGSSASPTPPAAAAPAQAAAPRQLEPHTPATPVAEAPASTRPEGAVALPVEPGLYRCELQRRVMVRRVDDDRGALVLNWQGRDHALKAVPARTGALRYESPQDGLTWLVISGKSMLLDSKRGVQLANECRL